MFVVNQEGPGRSEIDARAAAKALAKENAKYKKGKASPATKDTENICPNAGSESEGRGKGGRKVTYNTSAKHGC